MFLNMEQTVTDTSYLCYQKTMSRNAIMRRAGIIISDNRAHHSKVDTTVW